MPRTNSRYEAAVGFPDGFLVAGLEDIFVSGTAVKTRNAAADYSINQAAGQTVYYSVNVGQLMHKAGLLEDSQTFSKQANSPVGNVGRAPWTGHSQFNPPAGKTPKGIKVTGFRAVYNVLTQAATTLTARVDKVVYDDNLVPPGTVTALVAPGALYNIARANTIARSVYLTNPVYLTQDLAELIFEMQVTTAAGGTFKLYRIEVLFEYNYN